jgi:LCP family protein required for cell wall assembly
MGGPELAASAIEATYGVKIDNYAATNFTTFKNVINSLGGVNVNITADEAGYINWQLNHNGQASIGFVPSSGGNVTLNGQQALWLCRDRGGNGFSGDDFVRTSRQRRVIKSLISSYKSYSSSQVLSTLNNLIGNVSTDLSGDDLQWLAENSGKFFDFEIKERCAPDAGEWSQGYSSAGAWIIQVNDWGNLKSSIQKFIYEDLK